MYERRNTKHMREVTGTLKIIAEKVLGTCRTKIKKNGDGIKESGR